MFSKKVAVRLGALLLVSVTSVGGSLMGAAGAPSGSVVADHHTCC